MKGDKVVNVRTGQHWTNDLTGEEIVVTKENIDTVRTGGYTYVWPKITGRPRIGIEKGDWFANRVSKNRHFVREVLPDDKFVLVRRGETDGPGRVVPRRSLISNYRKVDPK